MIPNSVSKPPQEPMTEYTIRVKGCLKVSDWAEWFDGMTLEVNEERGETGLRGPIADQAQLYALLTRLRNLGLTLLLVERI